MNVTVNYPGKMTAEPEHVIGDRTLVYADADDNHRALALWLTPSTAAQWIEELKKIVQP